MRTLDADGESAVRLVVSINTRHAPWYGAWWRARFAWFDRGVISSAAREEGVPHRGQYNPMHNPSKRSEPGLVFGFALQGTRAH